ncbi:transglycosylase SLT domain-containing protein [Micromonospora halotolerans]|uniref:Transglycosylase SLT domain-containing protein n=1 Tax=Micromonospora halotolerans TaxID=709879 RepID=A0ABZ0A4Y6_9ACTN|nr:transglycosylase SLT domain-containing protein [Micromonospora halotolerans]WNM42500.1 transglycosylase SLT domain-containing protein [Micromonospora halotolerans]
MADGEQRSTVRPLRPAAPPDGGAGPVPRPRRDTTPARAGGPEAEPKTQPAEPKTEPPAPKTELVDPKATPVEPKTESAEPDATSAGGEAASADKTAAGRRRRVPFAHAVRMPPPRQLAVGAARATRAWSRRPSGRTTLPGLFLLALVAATATAGAVLVPAAVRKPQPVAVDATRNAPVQGVPQAGVVPGAPVGPGATGLPGTVGPTGTAVPGGTPTGPVAPTPGRPADALAAWAQQVSATTGIPPVAMQAYGYAELVLAQTNRSCQLSWTTLAAIGYVESRHGSANKATLRPDGVAAPEIVGAPLDGQGGRSRILDTDQGQLDHDPVYDKALGPMQFIPSTWQEIGADADNDDVKNPHDIDDAALAAGRYLCKGGRNMTIPGDWWGAILSYNDVRRYAQDVFNKADEYGRLSGT